MIREVFDVIRRFVPSLIVSTMLLTLVAIAKQGRAGGVEVASVKPAMTGTPPPIGILPEGSGV